MSPTYKYSYDWAQCVVEAFMEKYARGSYFISQMLYMKHQDLARYLIHNVRLGRQTRWEVTKRVIKQADRMNPKDFKKLSLQDRQNYLTYMKWSAENEFLDSSEDDL